MLSAIILPSVVVSFLQKTTAKYNLPSTSGVITAATPYTPPVTATGPYQPPQGMAPPPQLPFFRFANPAFWGAVGAVALVITMAVRARKNQNA